MPWRYRAEWFCPHCRGWHLLGDDVRIFSNGPNRAATLSELYPRGDFPEETRDLVHCSAWCGNAGQYLQVTKPAHVRLIPWES